MPRSTTFANCFIAMVAILPGPRLVKADVVAPPITFTASSEFNGNFTVAKLFDATVTNANVGVTLYGNTDGQWAGVGAGPFNVFMDQGSTVLGIDGFAYSQRLGGNPALDKVGRVDFWISNSDFGGVIPATPANVSVPVTNTTTTVLTQYTFGQLQFDGRYVAARFFAPTGGGGNIGGSEFRLSTNTPGSLLPELTINRTTGKFTLVNDTANPVTFIAYDLLSPTAGSLLGGQWKSIADNYDAGNPGPNQVDSTHNWVEFTPSAAATETLAEGALPGGTGAVLASGRSMDLGNLWIRSPIQDVAIRLLKADGTFYTTTVTYQGNAIVPGDFSFNGNVGPEDWPIFRAGLGRSGDDLTRAQAYGMGDLDADGDTDIVDFRAFEAIYDAGNGSGSLQGLISSVPEPSAVVLLLVAAVSIFSWRSKTTRGVLTTCAVFATLTATGASTAHAQVFTLTTPPVPTASTASSEFGGTFVVGALFQDSVTAADIGVKQYTPQTTVDYAGVGPDPKNIFLDFGNSISANYLAFAQRLGLDFLADKVGQIDVWFSNTDFANTLPATAPNKTIQVSDLSVNGLATLSPYSLGSVLSGRYVAAKLTIADISTGQPVNNLGGGELRLAMGPSDVVLEVNRSTGSLTVRNQGSVAQALSINGYEITSADGSLLSSWSGFENGSVGGFPAGNGTGNGWEKGDSLNAGRLVEAFLAGSSTVGINSVLPLGTGYNTSLDEQDLQFRFSITGGNGLLLPGVVTYVGAPVGLTGDYNNNGKVDGADYVLWRKKLGPGSLPNEDPTQSPGVVDGADYTVWRSRFGNAGPGAGTSQATVPEPSALLFASLALGALSLTRGRRLARGKQLASVAAILTGLLVSSSRAATPDAVYLFGDNSSQIENGAAGTEVGQAPGADVPGYTIDHVGDLSVLTTFRDLAPGPNTPGQRPLYVNTAALNFPGTSLGSASTGIGIGFDGVNDHLRGLGLGYPQDGDNAFTGSHTNAYQTITTRVIDGWVRPTLLNGTRQDIVNDTYQFGIHITPANTWGMNFGSTNGQVNTFDFDSGVSVASTRDAGGWVHVQQRTFNSLSAGLFINGELVLLTPVSNPPYNGAAAAAIGADLELVFGSNLAGSGSFFAGQLDNFRLLVSGDNSGTNPNGKNYGDVDLSVDNNYIAAKVVRGDANGDGIVNGNGTGPAASDDVTFFVNHFLNQQIVTDLAGKERVVGDITSVTTMADFNGSGTTDILDWYILTREHINAGAAAALDLGSLLADRAAPEPTTFTLMLFAVFMLPLRLRRSI